MGKLHTWWWWGEERGGEHCIALNMMKTIMKDQTEDGEIMKTSMTDGVQWRKRRTMEMMILAMEVKDDFLRLGGER